MALKDFDIGKELGKGAFGSVYIVKRIADGKTYAMKRVKISQLGTKERENALNEVRILASLSHTNIIGYKEAFFEEDSKTLNIVMEFADDGDLESKIQKNIKGRSNFQENDLWSYLAQILSGLKYLHDNNIMHRDLKCANIFLLKNGTLKLGDLNVSKIVKMGLATTQTGTPYYASPEVWADKPYNYKSDIWSIACVLYELCMLKPPFRGSSLEQLYKNVMKGIYEPIPSTFSKDLSNIIATMLQVNPINRPNCDQLLSNPILVKRISDIVEGKEIVSEPQPIQLLKTIKLPRNMNEINQRLPKKKRYKEEMEAASLMNCDVNTNKKPLNPVIELGKKESEEREKEKEIISNNPKRNKEINYINNNLNQDIRGKDNVNVGNNYHQVMQQKNNNQVQVNRGVLNNPNSNNNNIYNSNNNNNNILLNRNAVKKDINVNVNINPYANPYSNPYANPNPVLNRPSSAVNRQVQPVNQLKEQPRTPMMKKNDNVLNYNNNYNLDNNNNNNNNVYNQQNKINYNQNMGGGVNNSNNKDRVLNINNNINNNNAINKNNYNQNYNIAINNNNLHNNPSQKNNLLNKDAVKLISNDKSKQVSQGRPQSAKIGSNPNSNDVNKINNPIIRKNVGSDHHSSPGKVLIPNKRPITGNSPRNKSPPKVNYISNNNRPQSGKDRNNQINHVNLNNNLIQKKVLIEKVNYDRGMLQNPIKISDPRKQNNLYNQNYREQLLVNNKNNLMNAVKVNDRPISRGVVNNQNGPKIAYINPRK